METTNDLIGRGAVLDALDKHCDIACPYDKERRFVMCGVCPLGGAFDVVESLPSVESDVAMDIATIIENEKDMRVMRKKGKWIYIRTEDNGNALYECSVCHKGEVHVPIVNVSYCWNCGADMRGNKDE